MSRRWNHYWWVRTSGLLDIHRKNSLFFKTEHGARVGDAFMSLIYSCELAGEDPFHYLTELQRHSKELAENPAAWMPWNYRETLARIKKAREPGRS